MPDPTTCSPTGEPWFTHAVGSGHLWPLLTGERAEQDLQSGDKAAASGLAVDLQQMTWGLGYVPEQVWEDPDTPASPFGADPATASIGFSNGKAAGSAAPLIWGQAQYLRLVLDLHAGTLIDQPQITRSRYLGPAAPADVPVTIASPANGATLTGANTVVTGTTTPGARVDVAAGQPGSPANTSTVVATVADSARRVLGHHPDALRDDDHHRGGHGRRSRHGLGPGAGDRPRVRALVAGGAGRDHPSRPSPSGGPPGPSPSTACRRTTPEACPCRPLTFAWRVLCQRDVLTVVAGSVGRPAVKAALFRQDGAGGVVSPNTSSI